jgi:hypothetical protein
VKKAKEGFVSRQDADEKEVALLELAGIPGEGKSRDGHAGDRHFHEGVKEQEVMRADPREGQQRDEQPGSIAQKVHGRIFLTRGVHRWPDGNTPDRRRRSGKGV